MSEGKKMFGRQMLFVTIFVNLLSPLWYFFILYLHKVENSTTNSLFHTVKYKNHSVGYIFHTVEHKSHTVKQRILSYVQRKRTKLFGISFNKFKNQVLHVIIVPSGL